MRKDIMKRKIIIRINEDQFKNLCNAIKINETTKSEFIREILNDKLAKFVVSKNKFKK